MRIATTNTLLRTGLLCSFAFLLGCSCGWYFAHTKGKRELTEAVELMVEGGESSDTYMTALALHALNLNLSGDTNGAIRTLSRPVERYYSRYKNEADNDERRKKMRAAIDNLIRTNSIAAAAIKEHMELSK